MIELGGIGTGPHAAMILADLGADVVRVRTPDPGERSDGEWAAVFAGTDGCVTPLLTWTEASDNEHLVARSTIVTEGGVTQAAPAPRFSRTPPGPVGTSPGDTTAIEDVGW